METFYVNSEQFWDWFNREEDPPNPNETSSQNKFSRNNDQQLKSPKGKRIKTENKPKTIGDTEAADRTDARYIILYGPHKPGKKNKVWESDGYLSLVGQMAHLCDLRGRMLEEPTILDDVDLKAVAELGELTIGNTEVQVIELDRRSV